MKLKGLLVLLVLFIMCLSLIGCKERIPVPPVDTAQDTAELVEEGMTLDQVYGLMSAQLKDSTRLYQAKTLEQSTSGAWKVASLEGGIPEDIDVLYNVLICPPGTAGGKSYMVFLESEVVIGSAWFTSSAASMIEELLQGTLISE